MTDSIDSVQQADFDAAEALVIQMMRSAYPALDLRRGTVLREWLIRPTATFYAQNSQSYNELQMARTLQAISENPSVATTDNINDIASNFSITQRVGSQAYGTVMVKVQYLRTYYIPVSFQLSTLDGVAFNVTQAYTVTQQPDTNDPTQLPLYTNTDGTYYFLLPMIAALAGTSGTIAAGTSLVSSTAFDGFIIAEAYANFSGGVDPESVDQLIARMPAAISHRSLESYMSIDSILRDPDKGNFANIIQAIGVQGYGDPAQLRDKHNAQGVAMGGKVDVYARTFMQPTVLVLHKTATRVAGDVFQFTLEANDAPGYYAIRAITDANNILEPTLDFNGLPAIGSYPFVEVRTATGVYGTWHDIDPDNATIESAYSVFQKATIRVSNVQVTGDTCDFKVELYVAPSLADIQAYVDKTLARNLKADYIVRCPLICLVGMRATVTVPIGVQPDQTAMINAIASYINSRSFVAQLTESELIAVLHQFGIIRVDMTQDPTTGFVLQGMVRDAGGLQHTLRGTTLDIRSIENGKVLLVPATCVFAADPSDITIDVRQE